MECKLVIKLKRKKPIVLVAVRIGCGTVEIYKTSVDYIMMWDYIEGNM